MLSDSMQAVGTLTKDVAALVLGFWYRISSPFKSAFDPTAISKMHSWYFPLDLSSPIQSSMNSCQTKKTWFCSTTLMPNNLQTRIQTKPPCILQNRTYFTCSEIDLAISCDPHQRFWAPQGPGLQKFRTVHCIRHLHQRRILDPP